MKNISRLEIILVTIMGLMVFAFMKVNFSGDKTRAHKVTDYQNETQGLKQGSYLAPNTQIQKTTRIEEGENADISSDLICDEFCQGEISKSLTADGLLTTDMIAFIGKNPASFAKQLSKNPEILSHLFSTLKADEEDDNGTQNAALAVFEALSDEDKYIIGRTLTSKENYQDRMVGLDLLEASLETQAGSVQTLNQLLLGERKPSVLSRAINIASTLPNTAEVDGTMQALTEIIRYNSNDHFSGAALLAKINIAPNSNDVYDDISASLASFSEDKNAAGVTALQLALQRYGPEFETAGGWYDDLSLHESVLVIAQSNNASVETRSQAYELLNFYFGDDE